MHRDREMEKDLKNTVETGGGGESGEDREQSQLHSVNMLIRLFRKVQENVRNFCP